MVAHVHPDCINASNPYHECSNYCFQKISERKAAGGLAQKDSAEAFADLPKEFGRPQQVKKRRDVDEAYTEASARAPEEDEDDDSRPPPNVFARPVDPPSRASRGQQEEDTGGERGTKEREDAGGDAEAPEASRSEVEQQDAPSYERMSAREKKLFDIRLKLNQARVANQSAVVAERKKEVKAQEEPSESRGVSKAQWYEDKKKRMSKVLDANGLDMQRAYMLDTQDAAEEKYKKREKKEAAFGWDVFNQKSLYKAYKKRADNISVDMEEYQKQKESDPDFYRDGSCLEYGKAPDLPAENIDRMVAELDERGKKRKEFSRRRRHHDEKDIDSINDRNEHFNKKIERAFGKYTIEIKNNLERGTALPD